MDIEHIDYMNERILVVDDEEEFGKILEDLLKHQGFKAHHIASASDALKELGEEEKAYTFLITDIVMPGIDGLELTKKAKDEFPDVCVIVMTGYSDDYKYVSVINAALVCYDVVTMIGVSVYKGVYFICLFIYF